jgi:hypothetical protein
MLFLTILLQSSEALCGDSSFVLAFLSLIPFKPQATAGLGVFLLCPFDALSVLGHWLTASSNSTFDGDELFVGM